MGYSRTEDKREGYNVSGLAERSLKFFIYYIYNGLYNSSYIYISLP